MASSFYQSENFRCYVIQYNIPHHGKVTKRIWSKELYYSTHVPGGIVVVISLQWRHNGRNSVSNHQPHDYLPNGLFRHISKKTSKLHVAGLCAGNSPGTGEFPTQMASNAENVSIWWRHHETSHSPHPSGFYHRHLIRLLHVSEATLANVV